MSKSSPQPPGNPQDPAFRQHVIQRMLRESISPEVIAREYGLNAADVLEWKTAFLSQLKTATKGAAAPKPLARRKETRPVVEDISRKRIRAEDAKRPPTTNPMAPFPGQSTAPPLTPADRANLEKTQRLILEKGQVAEAGKKFGMMPRQHYEQPRVGPISHTEAPSSAPPGHLLEEEAKEQFAKNWAKAGAGAPPLTPTPAPPFRQSIGERLLTRLQDFPVFSWLLHGGRLRSPWMIVALLTIVAAAVYWMMRDWATYQLETEAATKAAEKETPRYLQSIPREEIETSEQLIRDFFAAKTIEAMEPLIRMPKTILPLMRRYYLLRPIRSMEVVSVDYHKRSDVAGLDMSIHGARIGRLGKPRDVFIEHTPDGPKIDWETAVGYQPAEWQEFRRIRPVDTTHFRLSLQPSTFYAEPFQDPTLYRAFRLTYPGELRPLNGYVRIDSEAETAMRPLFPEDASMRDVIVGLKFHGAAELGDGVVEITSLLSDSWIMNYDDGAHHVDLPPRTTPATLPTIVAPTIIEDTDTNTEEASETTPEQPEQ